MSGGNNFETEAFWTIVGGFDEIRLKDTAIIGGLVNNPSIRDILAHARASSVDGVEMRDTLVDFTASYFNVDPALCDRAFSMVEQEIEVTEHGEA